MGKFIYILFIVGWVIYNLYKAANKNKPTTKSAKKPVKSKMDEIRELMEKALQENNPYDEKPVVQTPVPVNKAPVSLEKEIEQDSVKENRLNDKQKPLFEMPVYDSSESLYSEDRKQKTEDEPSGKANLKDFDITQAVLYSEILKRPAWLN